MKLKNPSSLRAGTACTGNCANASGSRCRLELPTRIYSADGEKNLKRLGFRRIANSTVDAIFALTELPEGWTHGPIVEDRLGLGWTGVTIYDTQKRIRVHSREHEDYSAIDDNIFPELVIVARYAVKSDSFPSTDTYVVDTVTGERLFSTSELVLIPAWEKCSAWLNEKFPDWRDSSAYWD